MSKTRLGPQTFLFPMPAVLVGSVVEGRPNFMAAAWCGIACMNPPAISVAINHSRHTLKGIQDKGTFSINVPSVELVKKVDCCGIYSGSKKDKSGMFDIFYGGLETAPLITECPVNLECRMTHSIDLGSHSLVIGEIVETHVDEACLSGGKADPRKIDPLIYLTSVRKYGRLGELFANAFEVGKE